MADCERKFCKFNKNIIKKNKWLGVSKLFFVELFFKYF